MQFTKGKKAAALIGAGAIAVAASGVAYAYYTAGITATTLNAAATQSSATASNVTATLTTAATGLVPGASGESIVATLHNGNGYSVNVSGKTLTLDFANMTSDKTGCDTGNAVAELSANTAASPVDSIAKNSTADVTFTGVGEADDLTVDQTPCIGATFNIPVTIS